MKDKLLDQISNKGFFDFSQKNKKQRKLKNIFGVDIWVDNNRGLST